MLVTNSCRMFSLINQVSEVECMHSENIRTCVDVAFIYKYTCVYPFVLPQIFEILQQLMELQPHGGAGGLLHITSILTFPVYRNASMNLFRNVHEVYC